MEITKKRIRSFEDLEVYQNSYKAMLIVFKDILPRLPIEEKYDIKDQIRRSVKAIPRLIAEGHSKRHQRKGFQKYIDDALAESNETIVSLSQVRDLYHVYVDSKLCDRLIDSYDKTSRQLYNLALAWDKFNKRSERMLTINDCAADRRSTIRVAQPINERQ
jgi:four helix bundle protein